MEKKKREEKERESVEENRGCSRMIPRVPRCGSFSTLFGKTNSSAAAARNELRKKRWSAYSTADDVNVRVTTDFRHTR